MNNELYFEFEGMLKKQAYTVSNQFHIEYDECFSEACLILVKSFYSFDPDKGCFSTHLYHNLKELYGFAKKQYPDDSIPENYDIPYVQRFLSVSDEHNFSGLEKEICEYAEKNYFNAEKNTNKNLSKNDINRYCRQRGYSYSHIQKSMYNIQEALSC